MGVFLARDRSEADFFVRMGGGRFPALDLWEITLGPDGSGEVAGNHSLFREFDGFLCWMGAIPPSCLRPVERDVVPPHIEPPAEQGTPFEAWFTITPASEPADLPDRPANEVDAIADLVNAVPELRPFLEEHVATYGELLPYVILESDFTQWFFERVRAGDRDAPQRFAAAVEPMLRTSANPPADDRIWNLIGVGFIEGLRTRTDVLVPAQRWLGPNTRRALLMIG
jgi:hypothetical protein